MGFTHYRLGLIVSLVFSLSSCSLQPQRVTLSGGIKEGYYGRLAEQIRQSGRKVVDLEVEVQESLGSQQNLQRLLDRQTDFALVQLDVASTAMRQGQVQAVVVLAREYIQVLTRQDNQLQTLKDLQGQRVAIGPVGSGIHFTANQLFRAADLQVQAETSRLDQALERLQQRRIDAMIYVGSLAASKRLQQDIARNPNLKLLPLPASLVNFLTLQQGGIYQPATVPMGVYHPQPAVPDRDIPTLTTATVLITHPQVSRQKVERLTWAILATSRKYAQFYPELDAGNERSLLQTGLFYIHPAAETVFEQGDPRQAWIRFWAENNDLQAGVLILLVTSIVGLLLRHWRRERSKKLVMTTGKRLAQLKTLLPDRAQEALDGIEELSLEHRLQFIDGEVTSEVYEEVEQKTQMFAEQCRSLLQHHRQQAILNTLLLIDDWQVTLQTNPDLALEKLSEIKHQYRAMLLSHQIDIAAYIELMELTLLSVMTLKAKSPLSFIDPTER